LPAKLNIKFETTKFPNKISFVTIGTNDEVNPESWTQLKGSNEKGI